MVECMLKIKCLKPSWHKSLEYGSKVDDSKSYVTFQEYLCMLMFQQVKHLMATWVCLKKRQINNINYCHQKSENIWRFSEELWYVLITIFKGTLLSSDIGQMVERMDAQLNIKCLKPSWYWSLEDGKK
jgi:hypothetical protein